MAAAAATALLAALSGCPGEGVSNGHGNSSDDGGSAPSPGAGAQEFGVCDAHRSWTERCADDSQFGGETGWADTECRTTIPWRYTEPAFIEAAARCLRTLACDESDDPCMDAGFMAIGVASAADLSSDELFQRCTALARSCDELPDDACTIYVALTDAGRDAAVHCLDIGCDRARACLSDPDAR